MGTNPGVLSGSRPSTSLTAELIQIGYASLQPHLHLRCRPERSHIHITIAGSITDTGYRTLGEQEEILGEVFAAISFFGWIQTLSGKR